MTERIPTYGEQTEAASQRARVFEAAGCRAQIELAAVLDIRQSSLSDAKRRGAIPSDWLKASVSTGRQPRLDHERHRAEVSYAQRQFR